MPSLRTVESMGQQTFNSLSIHNYRRYFLGQAVSMMGTWMQTVALGWLALQVTGSGTQLGTVTALQFLPLLLLGPWGGVFVDRRNTRHVLISTQWAFAIASFAMSALLFFGAIATWHLYVFALILGVIRLFDNPGRLTFVAELVGKEHLKNAITLNAIVNNLGRALGPMAAGALLATTSNAFCFLVNALTYVFVLYMLHRIDAAELHSSTKAPVLHGQVLEGLRYVYASPRILHTLIAMTIAGIFVFEWQISLALLAEDTFHGTVSTYADLMSLFGIGAVLGGILSAARTTFTIRALILNFTLMGVSLALASMAPTISYAAAYMLFVGYFSINVITQANTLVQLETRPDMSGRVMALWSMALLGSTPIGGPLVGALGEFAGARWGIGIAAVAAFASAGYLYYARRFLNAAHPPGVPDTSIR